MLDRRRIGRSPIKKPVRVRTGSHQVLVEVRVVNWSGTVNAVSGKLSTLMCNS